MRVRRATRQRSIEPGRLAGHPFTLILLFAAGAWSGARVDSLATVMSDLFATYVTLLQLLALPLVLVAVAFGLRQTLQLPGAAWRIPAVLIFSLIALAVCSAIGAFVASQLGIGSGLSGPDIEAIGSRVIEGERSVSMAVFGSQVQQSESLLTDLVPGNFFHALAFGSLPSMLLGAILFGLAFAVQPLNPSRAVAHQLESVYRTLEALIERVNVLLPAAAFVLGATVAGTMGLHWAQALAGFLAALVIASALVFLVCFGVIARRCERTIAEVWVALADAIKVGLISGVIVASLPATIEGMAARLGVRRALVEFVAPIVPMFLRAGDALFLATVAVFVADLTGHPLAAADIALLCLLAPLGAMLAIGGTGIAALALGAGVLVHLDLPILWVLPILVLIDSATAGLRSTVSTLVACAVMAMVSRGLTLETQTLDDDGSADRARFVLSTMQIAMVLALLAVAMGLVLLAGIGVGMRA